MALLIDDHQRTRRNQSRPDTPGSSEAIEGELSPYQREVLGRSRTQRGADRGARRAAHSTRALYTSPRQRLRAALGACGLGIDEDQEQPARRPTPIETACWRGSSAPADRSWAAMSASRSLIAMSSSNSRLTPTRLFRAARTSRRLLGVRGGPRRLRALLISEAGPHLGGPPVGSARGHPAATSVDSALTGKTGANHDAEEDMNSISAVAESDGHEPAVLPSRERPWRPAGARSTAWPSSARPGTCLSRSAPTSKRRGCARPRDGWRPPTQSCSRRSRSA